MGNTSQSTSTFNPNKQENFTHPKFEKAKVK